MATGSRLSVTLFLVSVGLLIAIVAGFFIPGIMQRHERAQALLSLDELGVEARPIAYFGRGTPDRTDIGSFTIGSKFFKSEQLHLLKPFINVDSYRIENTSMDKAARLPHLNKCRSVSLAHCDISELALLLKKMEKLDSLFVGKDCYARPRKQALTTKTAKIKSVRFICLLPQSLWVEVFSSVDRIEDLSISFTENCANNTRINFAEVDFPLIDRISFNRWSPNEIELPIESLRSLLEFSNAQVVRLKSERFANSDLLMDECKRRNIAVEDR